MPCPHTNIVKQMMPTGEVAGLCNHCGHTLWPAAICANCNHSATHFFEVQYRTPVHLCDGCYFQYTVAKAAGRECEFLADLYRTVQTPEYVGMERVDRFPWPTTPWTR
jgi:uncharacterized OB-fold protein